MIWTWVLAVMAVCPAAGPLEALAMDALLAMALCDERMRHLPRGGHGGGTSNVTNLPGGRRQVSIGSMDELKSLLAGGL